MTKYEVDEEYTELMTIDEWKACCDAGGFIDYDGYGTLLKQIGNEYFIVENNYYPSLYTTGEKPPNVEATHISWYNK